MATSGATSPKKRKKESVLPTKVSITFLKDADHYKKELPPEHG